MWLLNDREIELWNQISSEFPYSNVDEGMCKPIWKLENNKVFTTISFEKSIQISPPDGNNEVDRQIFKALWKSSILKKCKFFLWSILHKGINTMEVLRRRPPKTCLNPNWCVMCHSHCERSDHLLVNCRATNFIWDTLRA